MAYNIKLDVFEGPLDLLLHLIKENQVDIYDIPIASITEQYLEYIEIMKSLNLELAGEFLVMAATLTYIKSKMLLPKQEIPEGMEEGEEGQDPRDELVARLIEYKKYKEAALRLREKEIDQSQVFGRIPSQDEMPSEGELLLEVSVFELLNSFRKILGKLGEGDKYTVTLEEMSVTDKLNEIMGRLETADSMTFDSLFETSRTRMEVIATFLAVLELLRLKLARALQIRVGGEIMLYKAAEEAGEARNMEEDLAPREESPVSPDPAEETAANENENAMENG
ncbi:MAG: segregation/condensation protein A [Nitrospinae bacterium]|nr:segregation/condensation protein A [Nitrospinota bacterium]